MSDGSVFTKDGGFKVLIGQNEDFPLLQVSFTNDLRHSKMKNLQANHISLSPGKTHSVKVFGSHITASTKKSLWKLEGNFLLSILFP